MYLFCPAAALAARSVNQPYLSFNSALALCVSFWKVENTKKVYLLISLKTVNGGFDELLHS